MTTPKEEKDVLNDAMKPDARPLTAQQKRAATNAAKAAAAAAAATGASSEPAKGGVSAKVTYIPIEDGDMPFTIVSGIRFKANLPVVVKNADVIKRLSTNPWFSIDGKAPPKRHPPVDLRDKSEDARSLTTEELKKLGGEVEDPADLVIEG